MKKVFILSVLSFCLSGCWGSQTESTLSEGEHQDGQDVPAGQQRALTINLDTKTSIKIGVVDLLAIFEKLPEAKISAQVQDQLKLKRDAVVRFKDQLDSDIKKLAKDSLIMRDSDRKKAENNIELDRKKLKDMEEGLQKDLEKSQKTAFENMEKFQTRILEAAKTVSDKLSYDLILSKNGGIVYVRENLDVTQKLLDNLKKN